MNEIIWFTENILDEFYPLEHQDCSDECAHKELEVKNRKEILDEFVQILRHQKNAIIKEFINGERCLSCGRKKEKNNSDTCLKCLEEG